MQRSSQVVASAVRGAPPGVENEPIGIEHGVAIGGTIRVQADRPILDLLAELISPSSRARPVAVPRSGMTGMVLTYSVNSSEKP
jgi:hypothetical protein